VADQSIIARILKLGSGTNILKELHPTHENELLVVGIQGSNPFLALLNLQIKTITWAKFIQYQRANYSFRGYQASTLSRRAFMSETRFAVNIGYTSNDIRFMTEIFNSDGSSFAKYDTQTWMGRPAGTLMEFSYNSSSAVNVLYKDG